MTDTSGPVNKVSEFISLLKNSTNFIGTEIRDSCSQLTQKITSLPQDDVFKVLSEVIDDLESGNDLSWCMPVIRKALKKLWLPDYKIKIAKKLTNMIENLEACNKHTLIVALEIFSHCTQKANNMLFTIFTSLIKLSIDDFSELVSILIYFPTKNSPFVTALICQNYLEIWKEANEPSMTNSSQFLGIVSKLLSSFLDATDFKTELKMDFINILKIYLNSDRKIFKKPFILSLFIVFSFDTLIEPGKTIMSLFGLNRNSGAVDDTHSYMEILKSMENEVDECLEHILYAIKNIDKKPYFDKVVSYFVTLAVEMLKFNDKRTCHDWINKRGEFTMFTIFKNFQELRRPIIESILNETVASNKHIYASLLHSCCAHSQDALMNCLGQVQSTLQYLLSFDIDKAKIFISFIMPFIKLNGGVKDSFMLILRHSMLSKNFDEQRLSILGYMMLLKNFREICGDIDLSQCTQYAGDSYGLTQKLRQYNYDEIPNLCNEMTCIQIFDYLKRCFSLQDKLKIYICSGLKEVASYNHHLIQPIFDLLIEQMESIVSNSNNIFSTDDSLIEIKSTQPLPFIMSTMVYCLNISHKIAQASQSDVYQREPMVHKMIESIIPQVFEYESNFENESNIVLSNCALVLMEYVSKFSSEKSEDLIPKLFKIYSTNVKNSVKKDSDIEALISLNFIISEAWKIMDPDNFDIYHDESYLKFIWKAIYVVTKFYIRNLTKTIDDGKIVCQNLSSTIQFCCMIISHSAVLFNCVHHEHQANFLMDNTLDIFWNLIQRISDRYGRIPNYLIKDIDSFLDVDIGKFYSPHVNALIKIPTLLIRSEETQIFSVKACFYLLRILEKIFQALPINSNDTTNFRAILYELFQTRLPVFEKIFFVDMLFGMYMTSVLSPSQEFENIYYISKELLSIVQQDKQNSQLSNIKLGVVNSSNVKTIINKILESLKRFSEKIANQIQYIRNCCKINKIINHSKKGPINQYGGTMNDMTVFKNTEEIDSICVELTCLVKILQCFGNKILPFQNFIQFFKTSLLYYVCVSKYVTCLKDLTAGKKLYSISDSTVKLINITTSELTPVIHSMIGINEQVSSKENLDEPDSKKKKSQISTSGELQIIPNLIYSIEIFEKELASLSKLSDTNLMIGCKSNVARDFRIKLNEL